jgi:hypothetical protein
MSHSRGIIGTTMVVTTGYDRKAMKETSVDRRIH